MKASLTRVTGVEAIMHPDARARRGRVQTPRLRHELVELTVNACMRGQHHEIVAPCGGGLGGLPHHLRPAVIREFVQDHVPALPMQRGGIR